MNVLGFDTCFDSCSAAVLVQAADGQVQITSEASHMRAGHAEALMPMIARVLAHAGISPAQIDRIAVTHGPGTFTGTRIGVAAARAFGLALSVPTVSFSSLWCIGAAALERWKGRGPSGEVILVAHDANRSEVYVEILDAEARTILEPQVLSLSMAAQLLPDRQILAIGTGAAALGAAAKGLRENAFPMRVVEGLAAGTPELLPDARVLVRHAMNASPNPGPLMPLYLRAPDAKPPSNMSIARAMR